MGGEEKQELHESKIKLISSHVGRNEGDGQPGGKG